MTTEKKKTGLLTKELMKVLYNRKNSNSQSTSLR